MRYQPLRPQKIIKAEKEIINFLISLNPDRFNDKARKALRVKAAEIKDKSLSAKKSMMKKRKEIK